MSSRRGARRERSRRYPPLADYAIIGDCHSAALVSRQGSIDWCCLPRFDSDSCFGRLLDWDRGGHFAIAPVGRFVVERRYLPRSLMLETTFRCGANQARLIDFFAMRRGGREHPRRELVRLVQGVTGRMRFRVEIAPRLDFGEVRPWVQRLNDSAYGAVGSNTGLLIVGDVPLALAGEHDLCGEFEVAKDERRHLALRFIEPERMREAPAQPHEEDALERHQRETLRWWHEWTAKISHPQQANPRIVRSAIVLKALTDAPTGAIVAAPTTSLPEHAGGERNWDYRFSWIRDSVFTVHSLAELGCEAEADGFRRFIQRSAAGSAEQLQVLFAVDGKRRLPEITLDQLEGWRGSRPVRIGNAAAAQFQSDMYGLLLELAWRWSGRGNAPSAAYWSFLQELVEVAIDKWRLPDFGFWEIRSAPRHFVHSKVMCWAAVHYGIVLAQRHRLRAPLQRWRRARDEIRRAIETQGVDARRNIFVSSFGSRHVDAALLLLPTVGFVAFDDERMVRTTRAIQRELGRDGLILRYRTRDGLRGPEGLFVACTFWLVENLARQGRVAEATETFTRAEACANDLGLFAEEYAVKGRELLGNFPQGLTHLAHISAALALQEAAACAGSPRARRGSG